MKQDSSHMSLRPDQIFQLQPPIVLPDDNKEETLFNWLNFRKQGTPEEIAEYCVRKKPTLHYRSTPPGELDA